MEVGRIEWNIMGCCQSVPAPPTEASPDERALCLRESTLGYSKHHVKEVIEELLRLSEDGKFSPNDLNTLTVKFELNKEGLDDLDSPLNDFYKNFRGERGAYKVTYLGALIILLGKGTPQEKASFLYMLMPPSDPQHDSGVRTAEQVKHLVEALVNVACVWLPKLSQTENISEPGTLPAEKVESIISSAVSKKDGAIQDLVSSLLKEKDGVSQADFVLEVSTTKLKALTNSFDLRKTVLS